MLDFLFKSRHKHRWIPGSLYALAGSFIMAAGWSWYHIYRHPKWVFIGKSFLVYLACLAVYFCAKFAYSFLVRKLKRHVFWRETFFYDFNELFFYCSFIFLIFFFQKEWISLVFTLVWFPIVYSRVQKVISDHPGGGPWLQANRSVFMLAYFVFALEALLQYAAYHYYILDSNIKFFNIVLFRSAAMTMFWMFGFALANHFYVKFEGWVRYIVVVFWVMLFACGLALWTVNLGILYYSGLYLSPVVVEHIEGSAGVVQNGLTIYFIGGAIAVFISFIYVLFKALKVQRKVGMRYASFYTYSIGVVALIALSALSSFRNTPERAIAQSFYKYYLGETVERTLDLELQKKLAKFGFIFEPNQFYVNSRSEVFSPTTTKLLPDRFSTTKPNILVIELESFSSRLTDVYSSKYTGVTPWLFDFSKDPHTTIFHHYYNASTPTITGTLSQFCSFLPPTGHNEIQNERKLQNHHLLCLPEVLKTKGGYKFASYVTAVEKEFAHKDGIFTSMGVDNIYGTEELKKYISGEPLSWGYSDHQLFPAVMNFMKTAPQPFMITLATVDTHPPFDLPKDAVNYGDGSRPVLNMFHTTDDAFGKFWTEFKQSPFYDNTIVVAVADHAIFPGALTTDLFPEEAKTLTYYDENFFAMYVPDSVLPKNVDVFASGIDLTPTLLQVLNINVPNSFEGHSIFDDRKDYPNLLGMHELGLYINQVTAASKRKVDYNVPSEIECSNGETSTSSLLTLCDYLKFYEWKRQMFEQGRFWKH
jgi:phosphoglycerol transferase MdoB-like AlkP superfamily enzyme